MRMNEPQDTSRRPSQWLSLLEREDGPVYSYLAELYGQDRAALREKAAICRQAVEAFARECGNDAPVLIARSTGRINLLGMHVDHRGGFVNPIAVGEMFMVAQARDDDAVAMKNVDRDLFPDASFAIREALPAEKIQDWDAWTQQEHERRVAAGSAGHWGNYVRAAVLYLQHIHTDPSGRFAPALKGMNLMVKGNIPIAAGLSSSSALVVATAEACIAANGLDISDTELVDHCGAAEWYVGTRGGSGDHAAIKFGKLDHIVHIGSFPLSVEALPFPKGYRVVLANSLKEARKSEGARDLFNQRVASYEFGLMLLKRSCPELAHRMEYLRDVNPETLGVGESEICRMVGALPERASRAAIRQALCGCAERVERIFQTHAEPKDGYAIRQVTMYGVTECIRSRMAAGLLRAGDIAGFGELINISHDGDRVSALVDDERVPADNSVPDRLIRELVEDLSSGDPGRVDRARLWRQPGGYNVSCEELDALVDTARETPGAVGAGLVGAGLGGSIVAVVEEQSAQQVIENLADQYYKPRGLPTAAAVVRPVAGSGIVRISD